MKLSHALLYLMMAASLAAALAVGCRRIPPPQPASKPALSQPSTAHATTASAPAPKFIWYTIRQGDTAGRVAARELRGGQDGDITKNNPEITNWNKLSVGMRVRLPIRKLRDDHLLRAPDVQYANDPPPQPATPEELYEHPY